VFSEIWNVTGGGGDGDRVFLGIARFTFPDNNGVLDLTTSAGFTRSLSIDYASYFGSVGEDDAIAAFLGEVSFNSVDSCLNTSQMNSVEVVIFVANFNSTPSGISSNIISNVGWGTASSSGYVVVANAVTGNWIKAVRVGSAISSADQSRQTKRIALTVSEGILVLGADLTTVIHKVRFVQWWLGINRCPDRHSNGPRIQNWDRYERLFRRACRQYFSPNRFSSN
jgi:hypothetical protein